MSTGTTMAGLVRRARASAPHGRWLAAAPLFLLLLLGLTACGGGGGGSASNPSASVLAPYPASMARLGDANVVPVLVQAGPGRNANIPYVSVTVCQPGSTQCKTIDNVMLDTGSTGLRLFASQLQAAPALALPAHSVGGNSVWECAQFLTMVAWGGVRLADVVMGGERAASVPIQLMEQDPAALPASCASAPMLSATAAAGTRALNANGILGVGLFAHDSQLYFNCPQASAACQIVPPGPQQVQNPVALFPVNNNGVALQLPALPSQGASMAQGYLIFGVGTQANNQLGAASVVPVDPYTGYFTTTYLGQALPNSFIDSGSNGLFFGAAHSTLPACGSSAPGFYCPPSPQQLWADMALAASSVRVAFSIGNASELFAPGSKLAFDSLGGPMGSTSFDWGLPFFFGRTVFTVIENRSVPKPGGSLQGPLYAFAN